VQKSRGGLKEIGAKIVEKKAYKANERIGNTKAPKDLREVIETTIPNQRNEGNANGEQKEGNRCGSGKKWGKGMITQKLAKRARNQARWSQNSKKWRWH